MSMTKREKQVHMSPDSSLKVYSSELIKFAEITDNMLCRRQLFFVLFTSGRLPVLNITNYNCPPICIYSCPPEEKTKYTSW